jgi:hypothetical protein
MIFISFFPLAVFFIDSEFMQIARFANFTNEREKSANADRERE